MDERNDINMQKNALDLGGFVELQIDNNSIDIPSTFKILI